MNEQEANTNAKIKISEILEGTPYTVAQAYFNTLRSVYTAINPRVADIDWRLSRIADEYCDTGFEDGVAIARNAAELKNVMEQILKNLETLEQAVAELAKREAKGNDTNDAL